MLPHLLLILSLASAACLIQVGGPEPPPRVHFDPPSDGVDIETLWNIAMDAAADDGQVMVLFPEELVSDYLVERLVNQQGLGVSDLQVFLQNGALSLYGQWTSEPFQARFLLGVSPRLNEDDELSFQVTNADFGPFPVPDTLKESLSAVLTEAFTGTLGSMATGIRITSLSISDGQIAIVGDLR
jgi:hypothetical protein